MIFSACRPRANPSKTHNPGYHRLSKALVQVNKGNKLDEVPVFSESPMELDINFDYVSDSNRRSLKFKVDISNIAGMNDFC